MADRFRWSRPLLDTLAVWQRDPKRTLSEGDLQLCLKGSTARRRFMVDELVKRGHLKPEAAISGWYGRCFSVTALPLPTPRPVRRRPQPAGLFPWNVEDHWQYLQTAMPERAAFVVAQTLANRDAGFGTKSIPTRLQGRWLVGSKRQLAATRKWLTQVFQGTTITGRQGLPAGFGPFAVTKIGINMLLLDLCVRVVPDAEGRFVGFTAANPEQATRELVRYMGRAHVHPLQWFTTDAS